MALLDVTPAMSPSQHPREPAHRRSRPLLGLVDGYTLPFASFLLLAGGLGDRLGARRLFTAGLVVFTALRDVRRRADIGWLIRRPGPPRIGAALFMPASLSILAAPIPSPSSARGQLASGAVSQP